MANIPFDAKNYIFAIDVTNAGTPPYSAVVCLTDVTYTRAANVVDASSKCGTYQFNGDKTRSISISGNVVFNPDTPDVSEDTLNDLFENDTPFAWLLGPETPATGEISYAGVGALLNNLELTAPQEGAVTFTAEITVNGVPTKIEQS